MQVIILFLILGVTKCSQRECAHRCSDLSGHCHSALNTEHYSKDFTGIIHVEDV